MQEAVLYEETDYVFIATQMGAERKKKEKHQQESL